MGLLSWLFVIALAGIVSDTVTKAIKAKNANGPSGRRLDELRQQLDEQAAALANQEQQIAELQERTDFMERLLARTREQGLIDERLPDQPPSP